MNIDDFMLDYQTAWEQRDEHLVCKLFAADGVYHNTPFAEQRGHDAIAKYWQRVKLQQDIRLSFQILARSATGGVAHWHVTYRITSEDLFKIWAASTGTNLVARAPGAPLPRVALDGILTAEFNDSGLCQECRIWWHIAELGENA